MSKTMTQVGVAWKKTTQDGKVFLSVLLPNPDGPDIRLSIWTNSFKEKDNQPDYVVYKPADERPAAKPAAATRPAPQDDFPADPPSDADEGAGSGVPF